MDSEEDETYTSQASSKNLASLFEKNTSDGGNSSLMYRPPKQPKSLDSSPRISARPQAKAKETLKLIMLKVLQTYKFVNNAYVAQGKVGVAISGNLSTRQYQLTLYKEKTSHLAQAQINSQFRFEVRPNNYALFRDRSNILWSLLFDDSSSLIEFSTEIALAKWACTQRSADTILSQDLFCVECSADEKKVTSESRVEVALVDATITPAFKLDKETATNKRCTINVSNSSLGRCLVGLVEGSKKLIILSSNSQDKLKTPLQPSEGRAMVVEVLAFDSSSALDSAAPKEMPSTSTPEASSVRVREETSAVSSNDNSSSTTHAQTSLISRMAKVGQALPFKGARVPDVSESEDDVKLARPADILKGNIEELKLPSVAEQSDAVVRQQSSLLPSTINQQVVAPQCSVASVATSPPLDSHFSIFFSEMRTTNSELRMGINRITDKLEKVIDKMEVSPLDKVLDQLKSMETNLVSQLSTVQHNNVELIQSLKEDRSKNPSEFQHPNSVEHLMRENKELQAALAQSSMRAQELENKVAELNSLKSDLSQRAMKDQQTREVSNQEHSSVVLKLQAQLSDQVKAIGVWSEALDKISRRVPELERMLEKEQLRRRGGGGDVDTEKPETVRRLMNDVYRKLCSRFPPDDSAKYGTAEIRDAIRDVIKASTLEYLNAQNEDKGEIESVPSVSSTNNSIEEKLKSDGKYDKSSKEQDYPSQSSTVDKNEPDIELSLDEKITEVVRNEDCNDKSLDKTQISSGSRPSDRQNDSKELTDTDLPIENGQSISFLKEDKEIVTTDQRSDKDDQRSTEEDWSPKQPPPLSFDGEDSLSDISDN